MRTLVSNYPIVFVQIGPRGNYKTRPAIILGRLALRPGMFKVVVCTTDFCQPLQPNEILLAAGDTWPHPLTKLDRETVVVWDWLEDIQQNEILMIGGRAPNEVVYHVFSNLKRRFGTTDMDLLPVGTHTPLSPP